MNALTKRIGMWMSFLASVMTAGSVSAAGLSPKTNGSILQEDIKWSAFPAFPKRAQLAVLVGDPAASGPYVVRVSVPAGVKLMPHVHPEDRIYTVISGVFYIGLGDEFDPQRLVAYPPGSVVILPGGTPHFHWAKSGGYVTQVSGTGPLGIEYVHAEDDPRLK
ncbi:cupin domain-containing protein [Cupriavidus sp. 2SB]|uniref:cupin domain-containing protein n=1 Tax=Cupriavidus sp. 2SB TaxID=2502199 RepID=UPI001BB1CBEE|nr:cupin domain-containing protein [Cupriavidus sp. 2SB]